MKKVILTFISFVFISSSFGCDNVANSSSGVATSTQQATSLKQQSSNPNVVANTEKIKFKTEGGSDLFALKQKEDSAKLVDANDKEIARIKIEENNQVKLKSVSDKTLGYIVSEKEHWKLANSENKELYTLQKINNNYKLKDWSNREIYQIKKRDYGFDIEKANNKLMYKVKVKEGKTSLRDKDDKTIFSTKLELTPIAFACFGLDTLTREQQAALAYTVNLTQGR
ncbi:hypothetical protein QUB80_27385 [Chlorogloeopsis sp. ULAP01]|uniref:hypothetical protein n=1 Tax=Chlorogloeopsis sp. ULAP01 TaxID=3056483 RepID=UPI0025AB0BFD|nr:hypothetical protein [Chlorogloeopsis sp. ULAP01]MDM9384399.1 hypothetical protein [Chlorogloeopsis sp. ULAP01]